MRTLTGISWRPPIRSALRALGVAAREPRVASAREVGAEDPLEVVVWIGALERAEVGLGLVKALA